jgi:penicillin amidase
LPAILVAAPPSTAYQLQGLEKPAEILIDEWGVPHIYAQTHYDAFFVQGFNAARDRLWQIDLWRRRGLGELSAVFGPGYLKQDRAARLFLYRDDMYREWLAYGSDAKRIAEAFVGGINAFITLIADHPALLPVEFRLLNYAPAPWAPEDVVRIRSNGLWRNVVNEVRRARIRCQFGPEVEALWKQLEPEWIATVPDGLDPCDVPDNVLDVYLLAKAPVIFTDAAKDLQAAALDAATRREQRRGIGSNNWVVAPAQTTTGRPILADDPHRAHAAPSLRYITHLTGPGLDVIGAGEPALPGISIGHNQRIAFGLTIFPIDQEDLYVYQTNDTGDAYRYAGAWQPFEVVKERFEVHGAKDHEVELRFTRHGPVIFEQPDQHRAFAVRAAWLEPGMAPYFGSIEYMRSSNWREFLGALNRWGAPSENQVYADINGNIGYKPAGLFPRRIRWDGLMPVPGDGRYEWQGYFDMDMLPEEFNPERGWVATANAMNLPPDYPIETRRIGFEWSAPWRHRRLQQVLAQQTKGPAKHSVEQSLALQRDYTSVLAERLIAALPDANEPGMRMLKGWDGHLGPNSAAAAFYAVWYYRHLARALPQAAAPEASLPLIMPMDSQRVLELVSQPEFHDVIRDSAESAYQETETLLGTDSSRWHWGDLHRIRFQHPLLANSSGKLREQMVFADHPRGGSANSPNNTTFNPKDFNVRSGASFRMVLDVGNWDAALMTNAPGQSGDPRSPHYDDLLEGWASDEAFPLLYSREAVENHTNAIIRLSPAAPEQQ